MEEEVERSSWSSIIASRRVTRRTLFPEEEKVRAIASIHRQVKVSMLSSCRVSFPDHNTVRE